MQQHQVSNGTRLGGAGDAGQRLLFAIGTSGEFLAVSAEWANALGPDALINGGDEALLHPDDLALARSWRDDLLAGGSPPPVRTRLRDRTGAYRMFEWTAMAIPSQRTIFGYGVELSDVCTTLLSPDGAIELEVASRLARAQGQPLDLTASEFDLLRLLLDRVGIVQDADTIAREAFGYSAAGSRNFLQAHVSRLRRKLSLAGAGGLICTVRGIGYVVR